jgi:hypothetical protein
VSSNVLRECHNCTQSFIRKVFKDIFQIEQDEEFIGHLGASRAEIQNFLDDVGDGPDRDNLLFDLAGRHDSPWNKRVIEILADRLEEQRSVLPRDKRPPKRPRWYTEDLLMEKFKRCKIFWSRALPRQTDSGIRESADELQRRLNETKEKASKAQRQNTRRLNVSCIQLNTKNC